MKTPTTPRQTNHIFKIMMYTCVMVLCTITKLNYLNKLDQTTTQKNLLSSMTHKNNFGIHMSTSHDEESRAGIFSRILVLESDPEVYTFCQMECKVCMHYGCGGTS